MSKQNRIRQIVIRKDVGLTAQIIQKNDLVFSKFGIDAPTFIFVKRGRKILTVGKKKIILDAGDAVAPAVGSICDVENYTDHGEYEAHWIVFDDHIVTEFEKRFPKLLTMKEAVPLKGLGADFFKSFDEAVNAISQTNLPPLIAENRVSELLLWLAQTGFVFSSAKPEGLHKKVRSLISQAPQKQWASREVSDAFAMSEATFRRKLSEESVSFSEILIDTRMTTALTLLQVTDTPISEIAYQVGYESASRFSVRFKKRFGCSPNAIRG